MITRRLRKRLTSRPARRQFAMLAGFAVILGCIAWVLPLAALLLVGLLLVLYGIEVPA